MMLKRLLFSAAFCFIMAAGLGLYMDVLMAVNHDFLMGLL